MKIHKNSVSIELDLGEFLEILETATLDDLILLIMELDEGNPGDALNGSEEYDLSYETYIVEDPDELFDLFGIPYDEIQMFPINEDIDEVLEEFGLDGFFGWDDDHLSKEDKKIKRILNKYRDLIGGIS